MILIANVFIYLKDANGTSRDVCVSMVVQDCFNPGAAAWFRWFKEFTWPLGVNLMHQKYIFFILFKSA